MRLIPGGSSANTPMETADINEGFARRGDDDDDDDVVGRQPGPHKRWLHVP